MPPKGQVARGPRQPQPKGFARSTYDELTNPENRQVLTALGVFVVCVLSCNDEVSGGLITDGIVGWRRILPLELGRDHPASMNDFRIPTRYIEDGGIEM